MKSSAVPAVIFALSITALPALGQDAAGKHYQYTGPLSAWMAEGASPGVITGGLPLTIVLSDNGATISPDSFQIKAPRWSAPATLTLTNLKLASGKLTGSIAVKNSSGAPLEGMRFDVAGATEEYHAKDNQGKDVLKTRQQMATAPSALLFGDLPADAASDSTSLEVDGLSFQPETTRISVFDKNGRFVRVFGRGGPAHKDEGAWTGQIQGVSAMDIAFGMDGRVYVANGASSENVLMFLPF